MSDSINDRSAYQSNDGDYGIWYCSGFWVLGDLWYLGKCSGDAYTSEDNICVHDIGWKWYYSDNGWQVAGDGLGTRCTGTCEMWIYYILLLSLSFVDAEQGYVFKK